MYAKGLETLLAIAIVTALAPIIVAALPGRPVPQAVIFVCSGILIGPEGLGLTETGTVRLLSDVGLCYLFLLTGYELDTGLLRRQAGRLAMAGWAVGAAMAVAATAGLHDAGVVRDFVLVGLALTTTGLGTLTPIMRDGRNLTGKSSGHLGAAWAAGQLFPIIVVAFILTGRQGLTAAVTIAAAGTAVLLFATVRRATGSARVPAVIHQGQHAIAQAVLRWSVVLVVALVVCSQRFGLHVAVGAMIAGIILRGASRRIDGDAARLEDKLHAAGHGVFIPVFFVTSGMTLDVAGVVRNPMRVLLFLGLLLAARGVASLTVYRRVLPARQRAEMIFLTAATFSLLVAVVEIGLSDGVVLPANGVALIGAGILSVLIFPSIAGRVTRSQPPASMAGDDETDGFGSASPAGH